jgi:hypothetical protein
MPADDLYRLVGVSADASVERLRAAYEQAVAAATRSGDHQRALELSTAFDALPPGTRTQVYRNVRHGAGPVDPWYRTDPYPAERPVATKVRGSRRRRRPRRSSGKRVRAAGLLRRLLLLAAVALVTGFVVYLALFGRPAG